MTPTLLDAQHVETSAGMVQAAYLGTVLLAKVRRNQATNPRATSVANWARRFSGYTAGSVSGAVDGPLGITTYQRYTFTTEQAATGRGWDHWGNVDNFPSSAGLKIGPGVTMTVSSFLRYTGTQPIRGQVTGRFYGADNASLGPSSGTSVLLQGAGWQRVSWTFTTPAGCDHVALESRSTAASTNLLVGDILEGTALLVERHPTLGSYFDPVLDPEARWDGTVNASTSWLWGLP